MRMYDRKCICKRGNVEKLVVCRIGGIGNKQFMKVGFPIINYEPFLNDSPLRCMKQNAGGESLLQNYMYRLFAALDNEGSFFQPLRCSFEGDFPRFFGR